MIAELLEAVLSWRTLGLALLVFGVAPGFVLRILLLCYPKGDPRRRELMADLAALKYAERPFWVASQVETAVCEGLPLRWATGRRRRRARIERLTTLVSGYSARVVVAWMGALGLVSGTLGAVAELLNAGVLIGAQGVAQAVAIFCQLAAVVGAGLVTGFLWIETRIMGRGLR